jgi:cytochrome c oxidase cbb3-type subunit 4
VSAFWGNLAGVVTVVLMVCFIGIWVWAWLPRHRRAFDAMAHIPMDDSPCRDDVTGEPMGESAGESASEPMSDGERLHGDEMR